MPALLAATLVLGACDKPTDATPAAQAPEPSITEQSLALVPGGPWSEGDQLGMANTLGRGTWLRCSEFLSDPGAGSYELSHVRSNDMTQSPFGVPLKYEYPPDRRYPRHAARI